MVGFSLQMMIKLESSGGGREKKEEGGLTMFWSQAAQVCGRERLCFQSLLLIRATGPPPGLPLGRLNEMRDGHYSL